MGRLSDSNSSCAIARKQRSATSRNPKQSSRRICSKGEQDGDQTSGLPSSNFISISVDMFKLRSDMFAYASNHRIQRRNSSSSSGEDRSSVEKIEGRTGSSLIGRPETMPSNDGDASCASGDAPPDADERSARRERTRTGVLSSASDRLPGLGTCGRIIPGAVSGS